MSWGYLYIISIHDQTLADAQRTAGAYPLPRFAVFGESARTAAQSARRVSARVLRAGSTMLAAIAGWLDTTTATTGRVDHPTTC